MPFDLKGLLQRANRNAIRILTIEKVKKIDIESVIVNEPKQEIEIPVYEPAYESDQDIDYAPIKMKRKETDRITRRVSLDPLSNA